MATYAIGDIQGCFTPFLQLLQKIDFNPGKDDLWLAGDLVNRGPQSLEVLRWVFKHQDQVQIVLGNHDLHLLGLSEGLGWPHRSDTLDEVLNAAESKVLLGWLRCQPMMLLGQNHAMVHAGLLPEWSISRALGLAQEVESHLAGPHFRRFFSHLSGNRPLRWSEELNERDRLRLTVNAMTRLRFLTTNGEMDLTYKGERDQAPEGLIPWFEAEDKAYGQTPLIFGHWSALGLYLNDEVIALDSGCVWGGSLSAYCLDNGATFSLPCPAYAELKT